MKRGAVGRVLGSGRDGRGWLGEYGAGRGGAEETLAAATKMSL